MSIDKFLRSMTKSELVGYMKLHLFLKESTYFTAMREHKIEINYDNPTLKQRLKIIWRVVKHLLFNLSEEEKK